MLSSQQRISPIYTKNDIFGTYEKNIVPVIDFYKQTNLLKVVNGETSISKISDEISDLIESI